MLRDPDSPDPDAALDEVLADYLRRVDAGKPVDADAFLAAHPDHAAELREYLSHAAAVADAAEGPTVGYASEATPRHALGIRCPHCHAPQNVAVDASLTDLTCPSCGGHFSLVCHDKTTRAATSLTKLGRFDLIERLGMGGFGTVWKARDNELDRTVAIKIPRHGGMTAEDEEKFFREARAAAQLRHPNIVSVHEVGRDGDSIYIVSDFVRGVNLDDWLTAQRLASREAAELCAKIADALHHAHEQGVVHRDLKPANILIDGDGQPHLVDFGLARRDAGEVTVTMDGLVMGTPAYMPPEQARGESHLADRRSDVYSLGVILFQLLTGEQPFRGSTPMVIHQVINDEPPSPRRLNAAIPKDLETLTLKCLEKKPSDRYQTAGQAADELRRFLNREPIHARPVGRVERAWRSCTRRPLVAGLVAALVISILAGLVISTTQWQRAARLATRETKARTEAENSAREANEQRKRAETWLLGHMLAQAGAFLDTQPFRSMTALDRVPAHERTFAWRLVAKKASPLIAMYEGHAKSIAALSFMPGGDQFATVGEDSAIKFWNRRSPMSIWTSGFPGPGFAVATSPDGTHVAAGSDRPAVMVWDTTTGKVKHWLAGHKRGIGDVEFHPDGSTFASGSWDSTIRLWDLHSGELIRILEGVHESAIYAIAYSPDGAKLYSTGPDGVLVEWDVREGKLLRTVQASRFTQNHVAVSPDGSKLVLTGYDWALKCLDAEDFTPLWQIDARTEQPQAAAFSPSGESVASVGADGGIYFRAASTGALHHVIAGRHQASMGSVEWTADGQAVVVGSSDGSLSEWSATPYVADAEIDLGGRPACLAWRPDGQSLLFGGPDGILWLYDIDGHTFASHRVAQVGDVRDIAWASDGERCAIAGSKATVCARVARGGVEIETKHPLADFVCLALASTDKLLACGDFAGAVELRRFPSLTLVKRLDDETESVTDAAFSPDGDLLATTGLWTVKHSKTGSCFLRLVAAPETRERLSGHHNHENCAAFSPDGKLLATGGDDRKIILRDVSSRKILHEMTGHPGAVLAVSFSPDGAFLASTDRLGSVRVWHAPTGLLVVELIKPAVEQVDVRFSPRGEALAAVGVDGKVRLWRTSDSPATTAATSEPRRLAAVP